MNTANYPAGAIPIYSGTGDEAASLEALEKSNRMFLKTACNEFLYKWVPPGMTIAEFEQVSCGLFARIVEEWEKKEKLKR